MLALMVVGIPSWAACAYAYGACGHMVHGPILLAAHAIANRSKDSRCLADGVLVPVWPPRHTIRQRKMEPVSMEEYGM